MSDAQLPGAASAGRTLELRFGAADILDTEVLLPDDGDGLSERMMSRLRVAAVERELAPAHESVRAQASRDVHSAVMAMLEDGTAEETIECFSHTLHVRARH